MRDDPDGWAQARDATREDVRAVLSPRERTCPSCGRVQSGGGRLCERCGADLTARQPKPRPWRKVALAALVVVILAAVSYPLFASLRDDADAERAAAERRQAALEQRERERLRRESRPVRRTGPAAAGAGPLEHRVALLGYGERQITADARRRVAEGELRGRILGTHCTPYPKTEDRRTAERVPALTAGRYDCIAYTSKAETPEVNGRQRTGYFGNPYRLVIEYADSRLVWCKLSPRASEGARSLASVPVPVPCRDPPGPG